MTCDKCGKIIVGRPFVLSEDLEKKWHKHCYKEIKLRESL